MLKICSKCHEEKNINEFRKDKTKKDGYFSSCKKCREIIDKKYRLNNPNKLKIYYKENKQYLLNQKKEYYKKNKIKILIRQNEYIKNNPNKKKESDKKYVKNNLKKINKKKYIYMRKKILTDFNFKLLVSLRGRINQALKRNQKSGRILDLIGCTIIELKKYLNIIDWYRGKDYNIDHIIPCSLYDLSDPNEQKKCFNWRNMRFITKKENTSKKDKLDINLIKEYKIEDLLPEGIYA